MELGLGENNFETLMSCDTNTEDKSHSTGLRFNRRDRPSLFPAVLGLMRTEVK